MKTRLTPALPAEHAARLYEAMLADTLAVVAEAPLDRRVVFWAGDPGDAHPVPAPFETRLQVDADLGERISEASAQLLAEGHRVILVGSDCPGLSVPLLTKAVDALGQSDSVIGGASDGGYWLIGLTRPAPELFHDVEWSSDRLFRQTLAHAAASGLSVTTLPMLSDLDTPQDLANLIGRIAAKEPDVCGPRLNEALRELSLVP